MTDVTREAVLQRLYPSSGRTAVTEPPRNGHKPQVEEPEFLDVEPPAQERGAPFPVDALPVALCTFCLETARALEVEPEMVIVPSLVSIGAAIGDSRCLALKSGYQESAMLWATVVARPGSVKTAAILAAADPLRRQERHLDSENRIAKKRYENDLENWTSSTPKDRQERGWTRPEQPPAQRQIVRSVTMEELAYVLRDNPRGLLMLQDELSGWVRSMNQYKAKGDDRSHWLSIWSSVEMTVDRRSTHGDPLRVWHPFVAVAGGLQPDLLSELRPEHGLDDGFMDRILFAWPSQRVRRWTEATVGDWVQRDYRSMCAGLMALAMEPDELDYLRPKPVYFAEAARFAWIDLYNRHHTEMAGAEFDPRLHGAYAKLDAYAARLSLILHLTRIAAEETDEEQIDVESVENAWRITDYFKAGARHVYGYVGMSSTDKRVQALIEWMGRHKTRDVCVRDITRAGVGGIKGADEVRLLFHVLTDRGYGSANDKGTAFQLKEIVWTEG